MTRRIHVLPDSVANQIAAGEVVERPASVVKELVENALDARATRVRIRIRQGGKRSIRVSDDGVGMSREDAILSLDRHATSKITTADDLRAVRSFGFRGEALPSIAAVSRMTIETREAGEEAGTRITTKGGRMTSVDDVARRRGTTVEVEKLFFNAPARARFLKGTSAESRAISEAVTELALAHPGAAFELVSGDRTLLDLPAAKDVAARIGALWGREAAATLLPVESTQGDGGTEMRVRGLVQRPDAAREGKRRSYLFVNGRPFREPALVKAVDRGYRTTIPPRARPWLFLYLAVPEGSVDVNVHPTKAEVRFRDRGSVEERVEAVVRLALGGEESAATFDGEPTVPSLQLRDRGGRGGRGGTSTAGGGEMAPAGGAGAGSRGSAGKAAREGQTALFLSGPGSPAGGEAPGDREAAEERGAAEDGGEGPAEASGELERRPAAQGRLWQLLDTYVLTETREGLLIIDQHSAHERVLFERLMDAFAGSGQEGQRLLFPLTLRLTPQEVERVEELRGIFARAGFEVEGFGGDTVLVQSVPNPHPWFDAERCFREMVDELTTGSELVRSARNQHERIAMVFACKGAIKAGQRLGEREMLELVDALFATELPHHDVHGRPTVVRLSAAELERRFGRH